jgi:hypothetical protein
MQGDYELRFSPTFGIILYNGIILYCTLTKIYILFASCFVSLVKADSLRSLHSQALLGRVCY